MNPPFPPPPGYGWVRFEFGLVLMDMRAVKHLIDTGVLKDLSKEEEPEPIVNPGEYNITPQSRMRHVLAEWGDPIDLYRKWTKYESLANDEIPVEVADWLENKITEIAPHKKG